MSTPTPQDTTAIRALRWIGNSFVDLVKFLSSLISQILVAIIKQPKVFGPLVLILIGWIVLSNIPLRNMLLSQITALVAPLFILFMLYVFVFKKR